MPTNYVSSHSCTEEDNDNDHSFNSHNNGKANTRGAHSVKEVEKSTSTRPPSELNETNVSPAIDEVIVKTRRSFSLSADQDTAAQLSATVRGKSYLDEINSE